MNRQLPSASIEVPKGKENDQAYFNYEEAFSRNIGWVSEAEQQILRTKKIAIAGMGGVGGVHLLTLVRMGFSRFHISDMDNFELANFNRQVGAMRSTIGKSKVGTLKKMALDINPEIEITTFEDGIKDDNLEAFLDGVDLYIDGFDFFVLDIRAMCFARCRELGIACITAGPMGMGTGYLIFMPDGMSFKDYFGFDHLSGGDRVAKYVKFLIGLSPFMIQRPYLIDESRIDLTGQRGPSTGMACQLCAGVAGIQAVKILLGRGEILPAPYFHHFDPYLNRYVVRKIWWGYRNPAQTIKRFIGNNLFGRMSRQARPKEEGLDAFSRPVERILNMARWAPSGDNSQPWRFEILSDNNFCVHAQLDAGLSVYNYAGGEPTWLALGMLMETADLAALEEGYRLDWSLDIGEGNTRLNARMKQAEGEAPDPLSRQIALRSVERTPYKKTKVTALQKTLLEEELGPELGTLWFETARDKRRLARMNALGTKIRLLIPETHAVHRRVIDFEQKYSDTGMPASALGLSPLMAMLMKWVLPLPSILQFVLRRLGGIFITQLQMDILPARGSAAHFAIYWRGGTPGNDDPNVRQQALLDAGRQLQRFWLKATEMGLKMQPNLAPLCFARYVRDNKTFTVDEKAAARAHKLAAMVETVFDGKDALFCGRTGYSKQREGGPRSIRFSLEELLKKQA